MRLQSLSLLCLLVLVGACTSHRLPTLPPDRDPGSPDAPATAYEPPRDALNRELAPADANDDDDDPHAGHHGHHGHTPPSEAPK